MSQKLQIEKKHLDVIKNILQGCAVDIFVFGSRAKGQAREFSDLDILLKGEVQKDRLIQIKSEFEESNLPYKVDIILWNETSSEFKNHISADLVPLKF